MSEPMISISMARDTYPHRLPQGIYIDGQLESKMGFDIPETCSIDFETLKDGIYNIWMCRDGETPEPAVMVMYRTLLDESSTIALFHGLIVGINDEDAKERAYSAYNARKKYL